jgi:ABC-type branched-subunit amino acid transport system ATPase component/predicted MFS family arabinose efflux permease
VTDQLVAGALDSTTDLDLASAVRDLVPSEREVEYGSADYEFRPEPPAAPRATVPLRARVRSLTALLNLRAVVAGEPVLPLVMIGYLALLDQWDAQTFGIFLPQIKSDLGFSVQMLIGLGVMVNLVTRILAPMVGFLVDRVKRVWLLRAGAMVAQAGVALAGVQGSVGGLAGCRAITGVGSSLGEPVGFPLLADYYPPRTRGRVMSSFMTLRVIGAMGGFLIGSSLGTLVGWRLTFVIFGCVTGAISLTYFLVKEPVRGRMDRLALGADEKVASRQQRPIGWAEAWRAAGSVRTLRMLWFALPFITIAGGANDYATLYYVQHFNLSLQTRGLIGALAVVPIIPGLFLLSTYADRVMSYKPGRIMSVLGAVMVVNALSLWTFVNTPWLAVAIILGMVPICTNVVLLWGWTTIASLVVPARVRGLGIQTTAPWVLAGLVANIFIAHYADVDGVATAITIAAVLAFVGALFLLGSARHVEPDIRAALASSMADEAARRAREEGHNKMLVCRDVDVTYDGAQVLFNVDFDVEEGELVALLGTNGAGKSTLLRAVAGIQEASNGAIFLDGDDITHVPPNEVAQRGVVFMPGGQAVFPTLSVEDNLRTAAWLQRKDADWVKRRIEEVLQLFPRLRERWSTLAGDMSGGEQQMLALGQALLMRPRLLMIDELSLGLAPRIVEQLLDAIRRIHAQGTTIILVEQSVNVALQVAERAVYMEKGEIRFDGSVRALMNRPDIVQSVFLGNAVTAGSLTTAAERRLLDSAADVETVLQVDRIGLSYGGLRILNGVSVSVAREEVVGIVGPNGAGKTTLFDIVTGFVAPDEGTITYVGTDVTGMSSDARARLGLARSYQNVRLFPALTVRENIAVSLERHLRSRSAAAAALWLPPVRRSERRVKRRVDNLVESLGLGAFANKFVNELSTGSRRIVDIACLLAAAPRLLLLDEPSSGLAQAETEQLAPVIGRIVKETGCGVLIIEHDLGLVASVSDRLVAMRLGEVIAEGVPNEVLRDQEVVDVLLGGASEAVLNRSVSLAGRGQNP